MLPTPDTPGLPDSIYPPSEDSYLLLDALSDSAQTSFLAQRLADSSCPLVADLGTGSGVILALVLAHVQVILGRPDVLGIGIDVNRDACVYSRNTINENCKQYNSQALYLTTINASLFSSLRMHEVDLLIFNPPYVPTEDIPATADPEEELPLSKDARFDRDARLLSLSYSGGENGMEVTDKVLADLPNYLSRRGIAYILLCKANKPQEIVQRIRGWPSDLQGRTWTAEIVRSSGKQAGWERLVVVRIWRSLE